MPAWCLALAIGLVGTFPAGAATLTVFGNTNPWFAGVDPASNTIIGHGGNGLPDVYGPGGNVATPVPSIAVTAAPSVQFEVSGEVRHGPDPIYGSDRGADGKSFDVQVRINAAGESFGKSGLIAPINAHIGVFLPENLSDANLVPTLSFETDSSRNFHRLAPELGQMFFIGDGHTDQGILQVFDVPSGAARLWLGVHDAFEWNDNDGSYHVVATPVPAPASLQLMMGGLALLIGGAFRARLRLRPTSVAGG